MDLPWTTEEHNLFLQGYLLYGKCWIEIAEVVRTRNAYQVCSYATWLESHGCLPRLPPIQNAAKPIPIKAAETTQKSTAGELNKGVWSGVEHNLFVEGLGLHGRGNWSKIAKHVKTRSSTQVISHARYYFRKMEKYNEEVSGTKRKAPDDGKPRAKKKIASVAGETAKKASMPQASKVSSGVETKTVTSSRKNAEPRKYIKKETSHKSDSTLDVHPPSIKSMDVGEGAVPPQVKKTKPLDGEKDEAVSDETKEDTIEPLDSSCKIASDVLEPNAKMPIMAIGFLVSILGLLAGTTLWMMGSETGGNFIDGFYVGSENTSEL